MASSTFSENFVVASVRCDLNGFESLLAGGVKFCTGSFKPGHGLFKKAPMYTFERSSLGTLR